MANRNRASAGGHHALGSINAYLSSVSAPFSLKSPLPSDRDISLCLRLLLSRLHLPPTTNNEDLLSILKLLNCPVKINRSALKAPGTPHSWPYLLPLLYWLLLLARYADRRLSSPSALFSSRNLTFTTQAYSLFMAGEDDAERELLQDYAGELEAEVTAEAGCVAEMEREAAELEEKVATLRSGPSRREELERETTALLEDVLKFESREMISLVGRFKELVGGVERKLGDLEKGLQAMRKLKLDEDLQYVLNPEGSTPAEVMGIDYKNILKPSLAAPFEEIKKASVSKLEELMALRQQLRENAAMLEEEMGFLAALQAEVNELLRGRAPSQGPSKNAKRREKRKEKKAAEASS